MTTTPAPGQPPITTNRTPIPDTQRLGYERAEHLAALTHMLRPDWNTKAIITIIEPLNPYIPGHDIAAALMLLTRDATIRTPKMLHHPGPHWNVLHPAGATEASRPAPCPINDHARVGKYASNCPECRKLHNFPPQIERATYQQLAPEVQRIIDRHPNTVVLD